MFDRNIFSNRLIHLRTKNNILAKDLANEVGVSKQAISQYEKLLSTPSIEVVISIANYFNVSIDYLTGRTDNPSMSNIIVEQKLSEEETELLESFKLLDKLERNIIIGKIAEFKYNKEVEKNHLETSDEFIDVSVVEKLNR